MFEYLNACHLALPVQNIHLPASKCPPPSSCIRAHISCTGSVTLLSLYHTNDDSDHITGTTVKSRQPEEARTKVIPEEKQSSVAL